MLFFSIHLKFSCVFFISMSITGFGKPGHSFSGIIVVIRRYRKRLELECVPKRKTSTSPVRNKISSSWWHRAWSLSPLKEKTEAVTLKTTQTKLQMNRIDVSELEHRGEGDRPTLQSVFYTWGMGDGKGKRWRPVTPPVVATHGRVVKVDTFVIIDTVDCHNKNSCQGFSKMDAVRGQ